MEIYVARQPIFDRKLQLYGYELLYRKSKNNFYEGDSDDQATAELINNSFLAMDIASLAENKRSFINFSAEMLLKEIPLLLPKDSIVVEILERAEYSDELVEACKLLKEKGYLIALDDFVFQKAYIPLIEQADIIKLEFNNIPFDLQKKLIQKFGDKIKFLAEKVETKEEYQAALAMGYDYFQGYFFSKPVMLTGSEVQGFKGNMIRIICELNEELPDYQKITEIIETDVGMAYKLLRIANSVFFSAGNKTHSVKKALVRLGIEETKKWIYLLMLKDVQNVENMQLIKTTLICAKMMELLAAEAGKKQKQVEYFMTGLFSTIDVLLNKDMQEAVEVLALLTDVKDALLGENNEIRNFLSLVQNFEHADWDSFDDNQLLEGILKEHFMESYMEALNWYAKLEYE